MAFLWLWLGLAAAAAEEAEVLQLLQHRLEMDVTSSEPFWWAHFPKCGSSLINAIIHLPGFCPSLANVTLGAGETGQCWMRDWATQNCTDQCSPQKFSCESSGPPHLLLGDRYASLKGRLVGMFRQPEQRILSAYYDDDHNFGAANQLLAQLGSWCGSEDGMPKMPLLDFAQHWRGGMAYQLIGKGLGGVLGRFWRPPTTHHEAIEAARRVREGFAFVGITEMWDLSMCLFHKMFGGACQPSDFDDIRPTTPGKTAKAEYNVSELLGWEDDADAVVYEAALDVFHKNLAAFSVSHSTCEQCYRDGGLQETAA
mmetsp:Transcript_61271/g.146032  ORF Transcript_61271/g.146032 Transcript_61271/m.146032 type:complete len:312 (+) Transcript_61271:47-982(+)